MMQSTALNKIVFVLLLLMMLTAVTGCNIVNNNSLIDKKNDISLNNSSDVCDFEQEAFIAKKSINNNSQKKNAGREYTITFKSSSDFSDFNNSQAGTFNWSDEFSFPVIQLQNMQDSSVAQIANTNIEKAMTSWIGGKIIKPSSVDLTIYSHSEKYLSFMNSFKYDSNRVDYIKDYITIDMKTGKRMMLNDLIQVNEDFVKYIQKNNIAKASEYTAQTMDTEADLLWEYLKQMDSKELLDELEKCSFTQEQAIKDGNASINETIEPLVFRNSFFLQTKTLVIILHGDVHITFNLDDIDDFLKVEKW